jgi:uncharacterized protein (DUF58 family)
MVTVAATGPTPVPSRRRRSGPVPTWRLGAAAAVLSVVAALLPLATPWGVLVVFAALLVAAGFDWAVAVTPDRIEVTRVLPASLTLGQHGQVAWEVANPSRRSLRVALADEYPPSLQATSRRARLTVPGARAGDGDDRGVPIAERGLLPGRVGRARRGSAWPGSPSGKRTDRGLLRVFPPFRSKQEAELRIDRARILEVGLRSAKARGGGTEFEQLRDYSEDDEFRRIDWAATARAGRPIVRTYRAERNQVVIVLLDNGRLMAGRVDGVPRLEHAMDAVMMLTAVATRLGDRAGLVVFDRRVRAVVPRRRPGPSSAGSCRPCTGWNPSWPRAISAGHSPRRWPVFAGGPCW